MKFCTKCNTNVLDYEADAVPLDELQTLFAIVIRCTNCDNLIQFKQIRHEENTNNTNSTATEHTRVHVHVHR